MGATSDGNPKILTHFDAELWNKEKGEKCRAEYNTSRMKIAERNTRNMVVTAGMPSVAASVMSFSTPVPPSSGTSSAVGGVVIAAPAAAGNAALNWVFPWQFFMSFCDKPKKLSDFHKAIASVTPAGQRFECASDTALRVAHQKQKLDCEIKIFKQRVFERTKPVAALCAFVAIVVICSHPHKRLPGVV
mmetsp:Transcript_26192/g.42053  ORF Transcript_26192/g.42053 Transcript_26192/m.42053 type:complete len:189 (+) Transcript_26192:475-1041(+)|eukprot:CAMPEP_0179423662 /NCGR_PEP_ID=MMETSP0799-20121207/11141_1 /TAXON_ID=46947 /ORGANISM="Geminigera cryophila, Strain CCMP2564" /LENGTH=188 /DNA_ID=CAMNT_0021197995 /DNA_START=470 /DNA_END=1036 /DNA_ORIENTATION=+